MNSGYSLQHVDLLANPTFAEKYVDVTEGSLIIECEETGRYRVFNIGNDFLRYTMSDGNSYSYSEASMMQMYYQYTPVAETSIAFSNQKERKDSVKIEADKRLYSVGETINQ